MYPRYAASPACSAVARAAAQLPKTPLTTLADGQVPAARRRVVSPPRRRAWVRDQSYEDGSLPYRRRQGNSSLRVEPIGRDDVRELNLRTYGWATKTIYGRTQAVVQRIRRQAKQNPSLVIRPRTPKPVIMEPADPNDPKVGIEHAKRGWPRGLWIRGDDGEQQFVAYTLLDPGDPRATGTAIGAEEISRRVMASAKGTAGEVKFASISPEEVASGD